ncbi:MAG: glycosyltransferase family 2 protein [Candidatus Uhrbacteria bacterium]
MATLALQLLTYQKTETISPLFLSLKNQTDKDWLLYFSDNNSSPEIREKQKKIISDLQLDFPVVYKPVDKNLGYSGGHQFLFKSHDADYILLINDDTILVPEYIASLRKYLDEHSDTAAVAGVILRWNFSADGSIVKTQIIDSLGLTKNRSHKVSDIGAGQLFNEIKIPTQVFGVSGCLPMYRRAAIKGQLFDPSYFLYKEDVDLAYRLQRAGWLAKIVPEAVAYHQRSFHADLKRNSVSYNSQFLSYRNHWRNLRKHLTLKDWLRDGWAIVPFEMAKFVYFLFKHPTIIFRTLADFL